MNDDTLHQGHDQRAGRCARCGHELRVERSYEVSGRLLRLPFLTLAESRGIAASPKGHPFQGPYPSFLAAINLAVE